MKPYIWCGRRSPARSPGWNWREMAHRHLKPFEEKYGVTSEQFMAEMAAEDLEGGDDEYVQWSGEYKLMCDLKEKLAQLREIQIQ